VEETADVLEISPATVKRDWTLAKIWLRRELSAELVDSKFSVATKSTESGQGNIDPQRLGSLENHPGRSVGTRLFSGPELPWWRDGAVKDTDLLEEAESLLAEAEALLKEAYRTAFEDLRPQRSPPLFWQRDPRVAESALGAYVIVRELGRGGMGTVFLARAR